MTADAAVETPVAIATTGIYAGAAPGWTMSNHPAYNRGQAVRAFDTETMLLAKTFPSS